MSDTDVPRWGWGVIDRSALMSRMPVRLTRPIKFDDLPRPLPGFRVELMDHQPSLDSGLLAEFQQVINQQAAAAREQIATLQGTAAALGDPRGIEVGHEIVETGDDHIRYRTRIRLTEDVPAGEIRYKTGDWV